MLRTITLPLLAPALATAAVLVFVLTLGTFAVPQVIGAPAGFEVITTRIYADLAYGSDPQSFVDATTLAVLLMLITLVVVLPGDRLLRGRLQLERAAARDVDWTAEPSAHPGAGDRCSGGLRLGSPPASRCWP